MTNETITTAEELDALPVGSVVLDRDGWPLWRSTATRGAVEDGYEDFDWEILGQGGRYSIAGVVESLTLPLTVIYRPDAPPAAPVDDMADHYGHLLVSQMPVGDILARYLTGDERTWDDEAADLDVTEVQDSIARFGVVHPITLGTDGRVLDGHHRILAARALGIGNVPVRIAPMPAALVADDERELLRAIISEAHEGSWTDENECADSPEAITEAILAAGFHRTPPTTVEAAARVLREATDNGASRTEDYAQTLANANLLRT